MYTKCVICFISMGFHLVDGLLMNSYDMVYMYPNAIILLHDHFPFSGGARAFTRCDIFRLQITHTHTYICRYTIFFYYVFICPTYGTQRDRFLCAIIFLSFSFCYTMYNIYTCVYVGIYNVLRCNIFSG